MTNDEAERIAAEEQEAKRPAWFLSGQTIKQSAYYPKMTTDREAIVDHRMYLLTTSGLWKIE